MKKILIVAGLMALSLSATAEDYLITQYRAAPGMLPALLDLVENTKWMEPAEQTRPIIMRHSQGNHWDLMLVIKFPNDEFAEAAKELVDFELSFLATSETNWDELRRKGTENGFYHIEMFNAAAGKHDALMRQRIIENDYIERIGQRPNEIFQVVYGSDFDIFTIGFYESLQAYAVPADVTQEEAEAAAKAAGFKNRADVSFHLRELIVGHHDTLAVKVP